MSLIVGNLGNFPLYYWNFTNYLLVKIQLKDGQVLLAISAHWKHIFLSFDTKYLVLGGVVAFNIQNTQQAVGLTS